jgi:hypothetical protein
MAITKLTSLTLEQYQALTITSFQRNPSITSSGSPDPDAQISLGGWVGTDTIAFTVTDSPRNQSTLTIDSVNGNTIDLNVVDGQNPTAITTYWTVNLGENAINSDWTISFDVAAGGTKTGIWVFKKGKVTID